LGGLLVLKMMGWMKGCLLGSRVHEVADNVGINA
jgi:hypothetical protein